MTNEVIIMEFREPGILVNGIPAQLVGKLITTQILNVGQRSAKFNELTKIIIIQAKGTGFWVSHGDSSVVAQANVPGNFYVESGIATFPLPVDKWTQYIATQADI